MSAIMERNSESAESDLRDVNYIYTSGDASVIGGKAAALSSLERAGFAVPRWFALPTEAFYAGISLTERAALYSARSIEDIRDLLDNLKISQAVARQLTHSLGELCPNGEPVAVRSSAIEEDGAQHSFAGQLESFLFVTPSQIIERIIDVWRSSLSESILYYKQERDLKSVFHPPAVIVQRMIHAEAAGVAFSADPVTGRRGIAVVSAVYGLGSLLVSGESDADTFHLDRDGRIVLRRIAVKRTAHCFSSDTDESIRVEPVPQPYQSKSAISDHQVIEIAKLARLAERHFGRPQDIEWAIEDGRVYLLQSRPITSLSNVADPDGALALWDNSNISESYGGVTTPLTFSFARRAYEEVYRQFCRLMRVPEERISANSDTYRRMIGLIDGRIYYNLLNWYRVLALLPGFKVNRRFMEQMMGVSAALPDEIIRELDGASLRAILKDTFNLLRAACALVASHFLLPKKIKAFYARLDEALADSKPRLEDMRADELAAYYRNLERQLLTSWDAPLINDFFAMIFYGTLRRLTEKWFEGESDLHNSLLVGEGGIISAEPARRIREMAEAAACDPQFVELLCEGSVEQTARHINSIPDFKRGYDDYLARFGDRCLEELKLESETLHDDPLPLFRSAGNLARRLSSKNVYFQSQIEHSARSNAEKRVASALAYHPIRRAVFWWVTRQARRRVRERENLRFERTRLFGRVRRIFIEIGRRFYALDLIESARDIFYLEVEEVLGFVEGTTTTTDLRSLVAMRKAEFENHRRSAPPADRFETRGPVNHGNSFQNASDKQESLVGDQFTGTGCSPGIARGRARVVRDPKNAVIKPGEILIAERTDPGWIMLFASAAAIAVERGSLLSHSAIVAREMGIPAVVSVKNITQVIKDGDWIEIDGAAGTVVRLSDQKASLANV